MQQTNKQIAENIRAQAKAHGCTVKQTLEDCGINRNFLYDLERGNSSPSVDKINRIAAYFDVSAAKLLGEDSKLTAFLALYERLSPAAKEELRALLLRLLTDTQ